MAPNTFQVVIPILITTVFISFAYSATHIEHDSKFQNQYIIAVKEGVDVTEFKERNLGNGEESSRLIQESQEQGYSGAFERFIPVTMNSDDLNRLLGNEDVEYIEDNGIVSASLASWGIDRIDQRNLPIDNYKAYLGYGSGTHIYIMDTGTLGSHSQFNGRFSTQGYDYWGGVIGLDCNGHGTHCGGTAAGSTYGVASSATVHSVKVLNCGGGGSIASVLGGMSWVENNAIQPAVASMSLGGWFSPSLNNGVTLMYNAGVVVSVAAGNFGANACNYSPASAPEAITVGATDNTDTRPTWSNFGSCVDIFAPGKDIPSSWNNGGYYTDSGTSMACPHVSGAAAILRGLYPALSPAAIVAELLAIATQNVVINPGVGSPNLLLYIGSEYCSPNPCLNGGRCEHTTDPNTCAINGFRCICRYSYWGILCQYRQISWPWWLNSDDAAVGPALGDDTRDA